MRITKLPIQIAESALSIGGIRVGTEEPHYLSTRLTDGVEVRKYGPRIAAETTVSADEDRARNIGFRRLAKYIFGANHRDQTISMTAPVVQQSDRQSDEIAMTAPVAQSRTADDRWTIRFFMPSKWTMETSHWYRSLKRPSRYCDSAVTAALLPWQPAPPNYSIRCAALESNRSASPPRGSTTRRGRCRSGAATKSPSR